MGEMKEKLYFDAMNGLGDIGHMAVIVLSVFIVFFIVVILSNVNGLKMSPTEGVLIGFLVGIISYMCIILFVGAVFF